MKKGSVPALGMLVLASVFLASVRGAAATGNVVTFSPSSNSTCHSASSFSGKDSGEKDGITRNKSDLPAPIPPGDPLIDDDYDPDRVRPTWVLSGDVDGNPIAGTGTNLLELGLFRQIDPTTELDVDIDVAILTGDTLETLGDRAATALQQALASAGYGSWTVLGRSVRVGGTLTEHKITFADPLPPGDYTVLGGNNDETLEGPSLSHASEYLDADNV